MTASRTLTPSRQPLHTVYGGAHLFQRATARKLGDHALKLADSIALTADDFAAALGTSRAEGDALLSRTREKLTREPVEDFRIDFEDGFGRRPDDEEDATAKRCAQEFAAGMAEDLLPAFAGIRIKSFGKSTRERALRTLTLFIAELSLATAGKPFRQLRITLPKVETESEVALLHDTCKALAERHGLPWEAFELELMVETPRALLDADGRVPLRRIVSAAHNKCVAVHFGAYDYLSALGVSGPAQSLHHTYSHDARSIMQKALAGTGIALCDGATAVLPLAPYKNPASDEELRENRRVVLDALAIHAWDVTVSLAHGFYQGWDLHPGQLLSRFGASLHFFEEGLPSTLARLAAFHKAHGQPSNHGSTFDDAATVRGHAVFLLRGLDCGAFTYDDFHGLELTRGDLVALAGAH